MASTSQGLAHPERAEVAADASSVAAHCSAFATGKELGTTSTSQGVAIPSTRRLQPVPRAWPPLAPRLLQGSLCQASPDYPDTVRQSRLNPPARGKSGMLPPIEETLGTLPARPQVRCSVIGMTDGPELVCLPEHRAAPKPTIPKPSNS